MTTRTPRPMQELEAIAQIAETLSHQYRAWEATEAALAAPTLRAAGSSEGHSSEVPDPTHAVVASLERYQETCAAISEALGMVRIVQRRFATVRQHHPEVAREAEATMRALRCDGEIDPTCWKNAVRAGKCWTCYGKKREADKEQAS